MLRLRLALMLARTLSASLLADGANIRLADGNNYCSGRVEILHDGQWGTVCDDDWDMNDAEVVCRQLGCGEAVSIPQIAHFDWESGPIWLDDVQCSGSESDITQCSHNGFGSHDCDHGEDAGVTCSGNIRLADGGHSCSGRVEILHDGQWGTVCDDDWDMNEAEVVCRQLGCGKAINATQSAHFGQGSGPKWLHDVRCSGSESDITQCFHNGFGSHDCDHSEHAGVTCSGNIRLADGSHSCSGRVEILHDGQWGTVCDDDWDMNEAEVVCRQLGCGEAINATQSAHFDWESGPIWLDDVHCSGNETDITQCSHNGFGSHDCDHSEDAGVTCSVNLQQPNISFSAADGWFHWGSDGPEATRGYGFSIICSTEPQYPGGSFHLVFSGSNITRTQSAVNHSAVFLFPEADFVHQGNYSCTYEVNVSSDTFTSTTTELLFITVKASLAPYIGVGVTAGLLLILVPVIICFVKTHKRQKCQTDKKKDTQRAKNTYKCPQGETETDNEPDYENVETIFHQKDDSEDSDNDYIDVSVHEQISDMDNDYENEDIYANCV